ncbi:fatty acid desaturase [Sphingomonas sp. So64.6b]|uniref:fatty acid desaturase family protein n=1 Tax=Sphingomonas sp. So64.6b TaxID=2997354 RepID=UPI001603438C|nr:fatty acid desaturase [Sphingomonas sp. So64.6b]QNA83147.1 fatty acid desaturase [Sphingomonas sp. So64.6b]
MDSSLTLDRRAAAARLDAAVRARTQGIADDKTMLRTAAELTRELNAPRAWIYWSDLIASAVIGFAALAAAILLAPTGWAILAGVVAVLALYRAESFIHELTHIKHAALPGFRFGWNALAGIPLLVPSFMYEGVHNLHHARTRYGTSEDPEYLPLALMKPWTLPLFVLAALLAPVALLVRFAVLAPLSVLIPSLRTMVVERYSALSINPSFRRRAPEGAAKTQWLWQEAAASVWAIALLTMVATGVVPLRAFLIFLAVASSVAVINQVRTLVAHLWENEGEVMTVTAQYLDTVNVPPPALLPMLWAPVGLRYHALHHLLPGVPYHALGQAHRRISAALDGQSPYHKASYPGLPGLVAKIARSTMVAR